MKLSKGLSCRLSRCGGQIRCRMPFRIVTLILYLIICAGICKCFFLVYVFLRLSNNFTRTCLAVNAQGETADALARPKIPPGHHQQALLVQHPCSTAQPSSTRAAQHGRAAVPAQRHAAEPQCRCSSVQRSSTRCAAARPQPALPRRSPGPA